MDTIYLIATLAFFVTAVVYGLLAVSVWHKPGKGEGDWVFLVTMIACGVWCSSNALASSLGTVLERPNTSVCQWLFLLNYPILYTIPPLIRHAIVLSQLSTQGWRKGTNIVLNYLGVLPFVYHLHTTDIPLADHYGPTFALLFWFYFSLTFIELRGRKELKAHYANKPGLRLVMRTTLGVTLLLVTLPIFLCPHYPEDADVIAFITKFAALPPALAIAYSVLQYRFMDILLKRSLLYSLLSGLLLGVYLVGVNYGAEWLLPHTEHATWHSVPVDLFFILLLIFAFQPLKEQLQSGIDRLCFRRRVESADVLRDFSHTFTAWSDLPGLCRSFLTKSEESLAIGSGAVLFADGTTYQTGGRLPYHRLRALLPDGPPPTLVVEELAPGPLKSTCREAGIAVLFHLPCREQTVWFVLGEKQSGEPFLSEEIRLLGAVCRQLAVAIDNLFLLETKITLEREVQHREKLAAIGQLAATVAHEIRNPITGAKCLLEQVQEELGELDELPASSEDSEYVQLALEDLDRVEQSVSQLLTFARKEEYQFQTHNVTDLLTATLHSFARQAREKDVAVSCPETPPLEATIDGEKIRRTLLNLLNNALDAVGIGGRITVGVEAAGPELAIRVSDNGQGLSETDQGKIFEPFFTRKEKGTGLGLAIAKKIVEGHGGRLSVSSTLGQGTTFTLALPRQRQLALVES